MKSPRKAHSQMGQLPEDRLGITGVIRDKEEAGTVWVWAQPRLLLWPHEVEWLFSPVTGRSTWPGDIWGLDERGNLLLVETKLSSPGSKTIDPFEDFVGYRPPARNFDAGPLQEHWLGLYRRELLSRAQIAPMPDSQIAKRTFPGVVPYSVHRLVLRRWATADSRISRRILSGRYERRVLLFLKMRRKRRNPPPHYVGLVTVTHDSQPRLSAKGREHYRLLVRHKGRRNVHLGAVRAVSQDGARAVVTGWKWKPESDD
jgi:hypothetical protein